MTNRRGFIGAIAAVMCSPFAILRSGFGRKAYLSIMRPEDLHPKCFYLAVFDALRDGVVERRTTAAFVGAAQEEVEDIGRMVVNRGFVLAKREVVEGSPPLAATGSSVHGSRFAGAIELRITETKTGKAVVGKPEKVLAFVAWSDKNQRYESGPKP